MYCINGSAPPGTKIYPKCYCQEQLSHTFYNIRWSWKTLGQIFVGSLKVFLCLLVDKSFKMYREVRILCESEIVCKCFIADVCMFDIVAYTAQFANLT